jgi:hypothetical protein
MRYDAARQPDAEDWLDLDEDQRISIVMAYHHQKRVKLENAQVHAVAHVMVENQIALGEPPLVAATMARLMEEGLDRHDAIHAVGSVLIGGLFGALREPNKAGDHGAQYNRELAMLTAASWRAQAD